MESQHHGCLWKVSELLLLLRLVGQGDSTRTVADGTRGYCKEVIVATRTGLLVEHLNANIN